MTSFKYFSTFSDTHQIRHMVYADEAKTLCGLPTRVRLEDRKRRHTAACRACVRRLTRGDL